MLIEDYASTKDQTVRIPLEVNGADGFIEVYTFRSSAWALGTAWFNRAFSAKIADGVDLFNRREILGETVATPTDEYKKITAIRMAHIVAGWSFGDEVTLEAASALLNAHEHIVNAIDETLSKKAHEDEQAKK